MNNREHPFLDACETRCALVLDVVSEICSHLDLASLLIFFSLGKGSVQKWHYIALFFPRALDRIRNDAGMVWNHIWFEPVPLRVSSRRALWQCLDEGERSAFLFRNVTSSQMG